MPSGHSASVCLNQQLRLIEDPDSGQPAVVAIGVFACLQQPGCPMAVGVPSKRHGSELAVTQPGSPCSPTTTMWRRTAGRCGWAAVVAEFACDSPRVSGDERRSCRDGGSCASTQEHDRLPPGQGEELRGRGRDDDRGGVEVALLAVSIWAARYSRCSAALVRRHNGQAEIRSDGPMITAVWCDSRHGSD